MIATVTTTITTGTVIAAMRPVSSGGGFPEGERVVVVVSVGAVGLMLG